MILHWEFQLTRTQYSLKIQWVEKAFRRGRRSVETAPITGRPPSAIDEDTIHQVELSVPREEHHAREREEPSLFVSVMARYSVMKIFALALIAAAAGLPQGVSVGPPAQAKAPAAQASLGPQLPLARPQNHFYPGADALNNPHVPYPLSFRLTNGIGNALQATEFHLGGVPLPMNQHPIGSSAALSSAAHAPFTPAGPMFAQSAPASHGHLAKAPISPATHAPLAPSAPLAPAAPAPLAPSASLAPAAPFAPAALASLAPAAPAPLAPAAPAPLAPAAPAPLTPTGLEFYNPTLQPSLASTAASPTIVPKANALTKSALPSSTAPMMVLNLQEFANKPGTTSGTSPHLPFIVIVPKDFALQNPAPKAASPAVRPQRSVLHSSVYNTDAGFASALQQQRASTDTDFSTKDYHSLSATTDYFSDSILAALSQAAPENTQRRYVYAAASQ
ncbi:vegetative cell wall protein gp1-like [Penaeus chinensis]|uniref:vegetative cell wall protein gp1-like n=1 Tax=Penaeus chinensis TaxID=139456 RepID=UPI001FB76D9F|nr:vegetative cell wall protein gp1-like [Penaeus chinensis]